MGIREDLIAAGAIRAGDDVVEIYRAGRVAFFIVEPHAAPFRNAARPFHLGPAPVTAPQRRRRKKTS